MSDAGDHLERPRVVAAPDSFKGTISAPAVARSLAEGLAAGGADPLCIPIGDGGEGTMAALVGALGGDFRMAMASDPLGRPIQARYAVLSGRSTAIVETAEASGLLRLSEDERDAFAATSRGTGELIAAASTAGAKHIIVTVGGSATTDGGAGALEVLAGMSAPPQLTVLCDVRTAWQDAARVFGSQKGADARTIKRLELRLEALAESAPMDPRGVPMTGSGGGLSGALWAHLGAELVPGAAYVLDVLGFDELARSAALVITGEGRLDRQTREGKVVVEVARRCTELGVPCHAVVGRSAVSSEEAQGLGLSGITEAPSPPGLRTAGMRLATQLVGSN